MIVCSQIAFPYDLISSSIKNAFFSIDYAMIIDIPLRRRNHVGDHNVEWLYRMLHEKPVKQQHLL